jgi:hypothetical protein
MEDKIRKIKNLLRKYEKSPKNILVLDGEKKKENVILLIGEHSSVYVLKSSVMYITFAKVAVSFDHNVFHCFIAKIFRQKRRHETYVSTNFFFSTEIIHIEQL